jgi:hypothetical protein
MRGTINARIDALQGGNMSGTKGRSSRANSYAARKAAQARAARERAEAKASTTKPPQAKAAAPVKESPYDRLLRRLREDSDSGQQPPEENQP